MKRFLDNDAYYPRPPAATGYTDEGLRETFTKRYLETSGGIIGADQERLVLPNSFTRTVVRAMHIRLERKAEAAKRLDMYSEYEIATKKARQETQEQSQRNGSNF